MNEIQIGVVGTGQIGVDHIKRITEHCRGARVTAVSSRRRAPAEAAASICGARVEDGFEALLHAPDVDAIVITSPSQFHEEQVLAAIECGKYIFCEKPLAITAEGCRKIVDAEVRAGKRLVQVGFMRRYDKGYRQLKEAIDGGTYGRPLIVHCAHRNIAPHGEFTTEMSITQTAIHEIDITRWLLDDDYVSAQVMFPTQTSNAAEGLRDPQMILLQTARGAVINLEVYVNCKFGYDIQCEVVCENGVLRMAEPSNLTIRSNAMRSVALETDWVLRFIDSYDVELNAWLDGIRRGRIEGASAWDGYVAAVTADALIRSQKSGKTEQIELGERPLLYLS